MNQKITEIQRNETLDMCRYLIDRGYQRQRVWQQVAGIYGLSALYVRNLYHAKI